MTPIEAKISAPRLSRRRRRERGIFSFLYTILRPWFWAPFGLADPAPPAWRLTGRPDGSDDPGLYNSVSFIMSRLLSLPQICQRMHPTKFSRRYIEVGF